MLPFPSLSCLTVYRDCIHVNSVHLYTLFFMVLLPVDVDVPGLADSVAAVLCLGIHGGVPVAVVEYYCVSPSQVHPYTSAAS